MLNDINTFLVEVLYVLPYGQMSLWGATVITNMLSAIPWIGQDFVQFYTITFLVFLFVLFAVIFSLPTIGTVNVRALRGVKARLEDDKQFAREIPYDFLAMFIGLVDGDGYIAVTRTVKGFISVELVISLDIRDILLLEYLKSVLKIGRIKVYPKINTVKFIIGKVDIQEVLIPLLVHHQLFFLTDTRRAQYEQAFYVLSNNITKFELIPSLVPTLNPLPSTAQGYCSLPFFTNWIVGFTIAEGSFHVKQTGEFYFTLTQRIHVVLFDAFKLVFNTTRAIQGLDGLYLRFSVSSVKDLEQVINFFSFSNLHPIVGHKRIQYDVWINAMRDVSRFASLKLP